MREHGPWLAAFRRMTSSRVFVDEFALKESRRPAFGRELLAGAKAGQVAGFAMAATLMVLSGVFLGKGLFYPLELIAASVLGSDAIGRLDAHTLLVGVLVHQLGPALAWGIVFGAVVWLFKPVGSVQLMMWGLLIGMIAQIVDVYVLLPLLSGELSGRVPVFGPLQHENLWARMPIAANCLAHLIFGVSLSLYPWKYDPLARSFD